MAGHSDVRLLGLGFWMAMDTLFSNHRDSFGVLLIHSTAIVVFTVRPTRGHQVAISAGNMLSPSCDIVDHGQTNASCTAP